MDIRPKLLEDTISEINNRFDAIKADTETLESIIDDCITLTKKFFEMRLEKEADTGEVKDGTEH